MWIIDVNISPFFFFFFFNEASKVFIRRKKRTVHVIDTQGDSERQSLSTHLWWFELLSWSISSKFPLANHFHLPGSQSIFGTSQGSLMCAHTTLSKDGFYPKGIWVDHSLTSLPL